MKVSSFVGNFFIYNLVWNSGEFEISAQGQIGLDVFTGMSKDVNVVPGF